MRSPFAVAVAIGVGLIILLGYFLPGLIPGMAGQVFTGIRDILLSWAVVLAGIAMLIGILHLVFVHFRRLTDSRRRDYYSLVLLAAFFGTLAAGLVLTPTDPRFQRVVTSVQEPMEISLLAILAVTLAYASLRLWRRRGGWMTAVFVASVLLFLLVGAGALAGLQDAPVIGGIIRMLTRLPVAGMRGILLGVSLGSVAAGLRILLGADRPYSG